MDVLERPASLADRVTAALRDAIQDGELEFGEALSEAGLSEKLGVSRTPVREAFARLQREGLVVVRPQRGTFVFDLTSEEFREICDCRTELETSALRLAMARNVGALAERLTLVVNRMGSARAEGRVRDYLRLDRDFHQALFDLCGNRYLATAHALIAGQMAALRSRLGTDAAHMEKSFQEHAEIARHVAVGDEARSCALLIGHIGRKEGSYWALHGGLDRG
jgi:DNA-binding GntR family transcriptional regulator